MSTQRQRVIDYFKQRLQSDADGCAETVAKIVAKMAAGRPLSFSYEVRWGHAVAEDIRANYILGMIDAFSKMEKGELGATKTAEALAEHFFNEMTERAMRIEHSSNAFACAVSIEEQGVAKRLRDEWKWFRLSLEEATKNDQMLAAEKTCGFERTSIEQEKRVVSESQDVDAASTSRKLLAEMRKALRERRLSEPSNQRAEFWVRRSEAAVYGIVGKDEHPIKFAGVQ